jgi:hypothetical protein
MYTILVNSDNTLYGSQKSRVMQRSKLVDDLRFIVEPIYNGIDMTNASIMMEYVLPVSREYKTINLVLDSERYNDYFLQYKLPFDTDLTSQAGSLELQLTFVYVEMNANGVGIQRVRKTSSTTIEIIPITAWSDIVPDSALSALDQRLIKLDAQMRGLNDYMNVLDNNQVDNLVYDDKSETLQLMANNKGVGNKISVRDMLDDGIPVVDLNSGSGDDSDKEDDNDCDCGCDCENNVVIFSNVEKPENTNKNDNNVVEF